MIYTPNLLATAITICVCGVLLATPNTTLKEAKSLASKQGKNIFINYSVSLNRSAAISNNKFYYRVQTVAIASIEKAKIQKILLI